MSVCPKPAPVIFDRALAALGVSPSEAVHIGDEELDAEGAARAGMRFEPGAVGNASSEARADEAAVSALEPTDTGRPSRTAAWIWLGFVGVLVLIAFGVPGPEEDAEPLVYSYGFTAAALFQALILVVAASIIAYFYIAHDWRNTFGLGRFTRRDLGLAAAVVIASVVVGAALEPVLSAGERQGHRRRHVGLEPSCPLRYQRCADRRARPVCRGASVSRCRRARALGVRRRGRHRRERVDGRSRPRHLGGAARARALRRRGSATCAIAPTASGPRS